VFTYSSSLLPALDGALESSNGETKGFRLSRLLPSELQLVLRDEIPDTVGVGDSSSRNLLDRLFFGGSNSSADSVPFCEYTLRSEDVECC